ncbi:hypothetical protein GGI12_005280, partial [Dipsacomyces acuminosporus]
PVRGRSRRSRGRYSRSHSASRSASRSRSRSPVPDTSAKGGLPTVVVFRLTSNVTSEHLQEIFGEYGKISRAYITRAKRNERGTLRIKTTGFVEYEKLDGAQTAFEYMNGAMVDGQTVDVKLDKDGSGGHGPKRRRNRKRRGRRGGRRNEKSPPLKHGRSPSPYRGRRMSRDNRSPIRSRSPFESRRRRRGGGGSRHYSRSPSPRFGGRRGDRRSRSRSFSRGRSGVPLRTLGLAKSRVSAPLTGQGSRAARCLHQTRRVQSLPGFDMNNPTLRKIQSNPRVMAAMTSAMGAMQSKGFIDPSNPKPPSFMKMMQMMSDPDIKQKFLEVQQVLKEEGISFSPSDLSAFMNGGGLASDDAPSAGKPKDEFKMKDQAEQTGEAEPQKTGLFKRLSDSFKSRS